MLHIIILCVIPIFLFIYTFSSIHPLYKDIKIFGIAIIFFLFHFKYERFERKNIHTKKKDHLWSLKNYFISCEISIIVFPSPETVGSFPSHFFRYCCTRSLLVNLFSKILLDSASAFALMIFVSASF